MTTILYKVTNNINGKIYIGVTRQKFQHRMHQHKSHSKNGSQNAFYLAIKKYGWENFDKKVLAYVEDSLAEQTEILAIKKYNSKVPVGYNRTNGGSGTIGYVFTEDDRKKISKASKKNNYEKYGLDNKYQMTLFHNKVGFKHKDSSKKKASETLKKLYKSGEKIPFRKIEIKEYNKILSMKNNGLSYKKIAEIYDVTPSAIFYFLKREGG